MLLVEVIIEYSSISLNRPFSYAYNGDIKIKKGVRVLVPFASRKVVGYVIDVKEVNLVKANVFVVEGNGVNIEYELEIEYELIEDKKETIIEVIDDIRPEEKINDEEILFEDDNLNDIEDDESDISIKNNSSEIEMITDVEIEDFEEDLEEVKEDTKEYYEEILEKNLRDNVEVITTKSNMDSESFLTFFDDNITYYRLKCVHVESEKELEDISKKYNIKIDELLSGYDKDTKKVIFKIE